MSWRRLGWIMGVICACALVGFAVVTVDQFFRDQNTIRGKLDHLHRADGDSFWIVGHPRPVRLWGIDAPEHNQTCTRPSGEVWECGRKSAEALLRLIGDNVLDCRIRDYDRRYNRDVVVCWVGRTEVNRTQVADGWAVAYVGYTKTYAETESRARAERRNIWSGTMIAPDKWRKGAR